jgi:hypothetical protein
MRNRAIFHQTVLDAFSMAPLFLHLHFPFWIPVRGNSSTFLPLKCNGDTLMIKASTILPNALSLECAWPTNQVMEYHRMYLLVGT